MKTRPRVIIGADGPRSTVGRWAGLRLRRLIPGIQVRVRLPSPMDHTEIHFHPWITGAYGWLFPRGDEADVGLALAEGNPSRPSLRSTLGWFLERLNGEKKILAHRGKLVFGWIPVEPLERVSRENMMLAGDAAGHAHPITGAGIANAMLAGSLAGKWAVETLHTGDISTLSGYDAEIKEELGESLERATRRRRRLEMQWNRLPEILPSCWVAFREYYQDGPAGQDSSFNPLGGVGR